MRRLALLVAGGAVWLFLAAIPVFADGGPHVLTVNNGSTGITADSCAACHRMHTSTSPTGMLLTDPSATLTGYCRSCHGASGTGAATDVDTGVQYALANDTRVTGTTIGALRGGGFLSARIDSANGSRYLAQAEAETKNAFIPVAAGPSKPVTSAHLALPGSGLTATNIVWGNGGLNSSVYGPTLNKSMECTVCHNPHGNGNYRILDTTPAFDSSYTATPALVLQAVILGGRTTATTPPTYTTATPVVGSAIVDSPYVAGKQKNYTVIAKAPVTNYELAAGGAGWNNATSPAIPQQTPDKFLLYTDQLGAYSSSSQYGDYLKKFLTYNVDEEPAPLGTSISNFYDGPNGHPNQGGFTGTITGTATSQGRYTDFPEAPVPAAYNPGDPTKPGYNPVYTDGKNYQGFGYQMTLWCTQCHTRYLGFNSSRSTDSGDDTFMFRHSTGKYRICSTCHVAHGSNAIMNVDAASGGTASANTPFPDNAVHNKTATSGDSRLLKLDNRGICLECHDPTLVAQGQQGPVPQFVP